MKDKVGESHHAVLFFSYYERPSRLRNNRRRRRRRRKSYSYRGRHGNRVSCFVGKRVAVGAGSLLLFFTARAVLALLTKICSVSEGCTVPSGFRVVLSMIRQPHVPFR